MAKHVIDKDKKNTVEVTESDSTWIVQKGVTLSGDIGINNDDFDNVRFKIAGKINSDGGLYTGGELAQQSHHVTVNLASSAMIKAKMYDAINIRGDDASVNNKGVIRAEAFFGIEIDGADASVVNSGKIDVEGIAAVFLQGSGEFSIENNGLIRSRHNAAIGADYEGSGTIVNGAKGVIEGISYFVGNKIADITIVNKGEMHSGIFWDQPVDEVIITGEGDDRITNRGLIDGNILLHGGNDEVDLRGGKLVNSSIHGGSGDDTFRISSSKVKIVEIDGGGEDRIYSSASYTLDNTANGYIEVLQGVGKADIKLTGNDFANRIVGNSGDNRIDGGGGNDTIGSGLGNDTIRGGDGADDFQFFTGQGKDIISDFDQNEDDSIVLYFIPDIDNFTQLQARMSDLKDGVGTVIDLGDGNRLTIEGIAKGDLQAGDFAIFPEIN